MKTKKQYFIFAIMGNYMSYDESATAAVLGDLQKVLVPREVVVRAQKTLALCRSERDYFERSRTELFIRLTHSLLENDEAKEELERLAGFEEALIVTKSGLHASQAEAALFKGERDAARKVVISVSDMLVTSEERLKSEGSAYAKQMEDYNTTIDEMESEFQSSRSEALALQYRVEELEEELDHMRTDHSAELEAKAQEYNDQLYEGLQDIRQDMEAQMNQTDSDSDCMAECLQASSDTSDQLAIALAYIEELEAKAKANSSTGAQFVAALRQDHARAEAAIAERASKAELKAEAAERATEAAVRERDETQITIRKIESELEALKWIMHNEARTHTNEVVALPGNATPWNIKDDTNVFDVLRSMR